MYAFLLSRTQARTTRPFLTSAAASVKPCANAKVLLLDNECEVDDDADRDVAHDDDAGVDDLVVRLMVTAESL